MRTRRTIAATTLLLAIAVLATVLTGCGVASTKAPVVETTSGRLSGLQTSTAKDWLGVPYAAPPVGPLRWADPRPVARAPGTIDTTHVGNSCPQTGSTASGEEDCLYLNVTVPKGATPGAHLPVMVWLHGGGGTVGYGGAYGADHLAAGNVMVVTVNYRLGVFGYLGLPGLPGSGDFGLADQLAALRWVKANAAVFGGNAGNITVFGESAGGFDTCALLTSPVAAGLIQRAAIMSGDCRITWPAGTLLPGTPAQSGYVSLAADERDSEAAAAALGCRGAATLACLRGKSVATVLKADGLFSDHLAYGTPLLPLEPRTALATGHFLHIPVISGGTSAEEGAFVAEALDANSAAVTADNYRQLIQTAFGAAATPAILEHYPLASYRSAGMAWSALVTDASWACPTVKGTQQLAAHTTVYPYEFADPTAGATTGTHAKGLDIGAIHGSELAYLFQITDKDLLKGPDQHQLGDQMIAAWTSFARTGRPMFPGATWSAATPTSTTALQILDVGSVRLVDVAREHQCAFWAMVPYGQ